ncbi:MAG TPA: hypothetical protein VK066_20805 [Chloroflexota bacterium]|nr:hypothetical protein [Chloroflexota bacterium]
MTEEGPVVVPCAADPQVETALRCGRCNTPICPRCLVMTPVGARCRACARVRKSPVYDVPVLYYLRAAAAGLVVAAVGTYVLAFVPFFQLFGLLLLGAVVGEAVTMAANRKRGAGLAAVAVVTLFLGALIVPGLAALAGLPAPIPLDLRLAAALRLALGQLLSPRGLFLALGAVIAASRVR